MRELFTQSPFVEGPFVERPLGETHFVSYNIDVPYKPEFLRRPWPEDRHRRLEGLAGAILLCLLFIAYHLVLSKAPL